MKTDSINEMLKPLPVRNLFRSAVPLLFCCSLAICETGAPIPVDSFPMAAAVTPDGKVMLVLNAGPKTPGISVIDVAAGKELSRTSVPEAWLGLAITKAGDKVYIGGGSRAAVFEFSLVGGFLKAGRTFPLVAEKDRTAQDFAGDVKLAPDGHLLYVTNVFRDTVVVMNPQSGLILSRIRTGRRPYRILFHPSGKTMYVSSWADGTIGQYDVNSGQRLANFRVAPHPGDMVWVDGGLPAGASNDNQPEVRARMFVPAANTNSVYVLGASETGDLTKLDTINLAFTPSQPLGMTPAAAVLSTDKKQLYVACSDANAVAVIDIGGERNIVKGFIPADGYPTAVLALPDGRLGVLNGHGNSARLMDVPDDAKLTSSTAEVISKFGFHDEMLDPPAAPAGNPVRAGGPVKHVIYVVRDTGAADVARATAGIENDFVARLGNRFGPDTGPPDPANTPPAGYIWNAASQAGLKIRNYGFQVHNLAKPNADGEQVDRVYDPALADATDMEYRGPDPAYLDTERAKEFANEMKEYGDVGNMPELLLVRIGNDDQAQAIVTDALAKSKFRNETAMFVLNGNSAQAISPWSQAGGSPYTPLSALRTTEIILGLRPLTVFDASAQPMFNAFASPPSQ